MFRFLVPAALLLAMGAAAALAQDSAITPEGPQPPGDTMQAPEGQTAADVNARIDQLLGDP